MQVNLTHKIWPKSNKSNLKLSRRPETGSQVHTWIEQLLSAWKAQYLRLGLFTPKGAMRFEYGDYRDPYQSFFKGGETLFDTHMSESTMIDEDEGLDICEKLA